MENPGNLAPAPSRTTCFPCANVRGLPWLACQHQPLEVQLFGPVLQLKLRASPSRNLGANAGQCELGRPT
jgi:hypothetical protein